MEKLRIDLAADRVPVVFDVEEKLGVSEWFQLQPCYLKDDKDDLKRFTEPHYPLPSDLSELLIDRPVDYEELFIRDPLPYMTDVQFLDDDSTLYKEVYYLEEPKAYKANKRFGELKSLKTQTGGGKPHDIKGEKVRQTRDLIFDLEEQVAFEPLEITRLQCIPPGFTRGLDPSDVDQPFDLEKQLSTTVLSVQETHNSVEQDQLLVGSEPIDELIRHVKAQKLTLKKTPVSGRTFAHLIDTNTSISEETFAQQVPQLAKTYPFELDTFQKHALINLERGENVFVAAHTSAGKTVVAEYAVALSQKHMTRTVYTSPIKALSNQKFRDFRQTFGEEEVGLLTGDVQIRPEASCVIMTTEILRSMLYRGADMIRDVEYVIFDECHYLNDLSRGVVWEECLIMLPSSITIILLSATVPNAFEFADWVGRTKQKDIYVISTYKRPVPLEHFMFVSGITPHRLFKVVDADKNFQQEDYKKAHEAVFLQKEEKLKKKREADKRAGKPVNTFKKAPIIKIDRNLWVHLTNLLKKSELLPAVIFSFSKKRCEEYADSLSNIDLLNATEKSEVFVFIERSLARLKGSDKSLPQIIRMRDLLSRGIGIHHSGLLPIVKELVEILFARNLTRVLFATETFAMGVNMPARAVVFSGTQKNDGRQFRDLLPGEYTQMSGRAGRRGLDATGVVVLAYSGEYDFPEAAHLQQIILGQATRLESQFRLTYNMILNLLRIEAIKVEDMMKKSFSESNAQREAPAHQLLLKEHGDELKKRQVDQQEIQKCVFCSADLQHFYELNLKAVDLTRKRMNLFICESGYWQKVMTPGRVVLIALAEYGHVLAVVQGVSISSDGNNRSFECLAVSNSESVNITHAQPLLSLCLPNTQTAELVSVDVNWSRFLAVYDRKIPLTEPMNSALILNHLMDFGHEYISCKTDCKLVPEIQMENKLKDFDFIQSSIERATVLEQMINCQCIHCPDFERHFCLVNDVSSLKDTMAQLQRQLSDQNLYLLPEYQDRVKLLKSLGFVDKNAVVQLKGRVACEINSGESLVLTEMITENVFADMDAKEVVSLLSAFIFQEKVDLSNEIIMSRLPPNLKVCIAITLEIADRVAKAQIQHSLPISVQEFISDNVNFGLCEVVYEWACGTSFKQIIELTEVLEGSIVRAITRLDELCREIRDAARVVGNSMLYHIMEEASVLIKRDIVFTTSLYI